MNTEHNTPPDVRIELARTLAENAKPWSFGPDIVDAVMSRFDVRLRGATPPADDVREAVTKRIADEVEYRVRTAVTLAVNGHEYEQHVTQGRESVVALLAEARPYGSVTDAEVEAAAQAMFEDPLTPGDGYTWAEMVVEDPSRANMWRTDARRVLEAAREDRSNV